MVAQNEASIWQRVVEPLWNRHNPEAAKALLELQFRQPDIDRMNQLAKIAREGSLSALEHAELEMYNRIGQALAIIQSKARSALQKLPER